MLKTSASPLPKRCVLTGHSKGLGAAMQEALLKAGFEVLGISRHPLKHSGNVTSPQTANTKLREVALDLSNAGAIETWLNSGELQKFLHNSGVALLINNAGRIAPIAPAGQQSSSEIALSVALNISAPLMLSDAFIAATQACGNRRIMHISSGAGRTAYPGWSVYCASKAALDHHASAVASEKTCNLRISSVAPGIIDTDMQAEIRSTDPSLFPMKQKFDELKRQGLLVPPEEAASALIEHLLGDFFGQQACEDIRNC
jgi:NAD(P)-dependent dehydrogenase (short-subunit alcohol dehydrogenase family)